MSSGLTAPKASNTTHHAGQRSADSGRRRHRTLDGVMAAVSQTDGIGLAKMDALTTLPGADRQLALPDHDPQAVRARSLGPRWGILPRAHQSLSEWVEFRWHYTWSSLPATNGSSRRTCAPSRSSRRPGARASWSCEQACKRYLRPSLAVAGSSDGPAAVTVPPVRSRHSGAGERYVRPDILRATRVPRSRR